MTIPKRYSCFKPLHYSKSARKKIKTHHDVNNKVTTVFKIHAPGAR